MVNIVLDLVLPVLLLQVMIAQEERRPIMIVILEMMGGDIADRQQSEYPLSPFIGEDDFTHATQDEDHESRRAGLGIGVIGKPYKGRQRRMTQHNEDSFSASFESMRIDTQYSDSSNDANIFPPHTMSYG